MAFLQREESYGFEGNLIESSSTMLAKAEKMLKDKREQVEKVQYELRLIENDAFWQYKRHIEYDFTFNPSILEKAWKWFCMLEKNEDKNGKTIDKRKKYEEKEKYNWIFDELKKQLGKDDIKITNFLMHSWGQAYDIQFTTSGHSFQLEIPVVKNITLDSYLRYGSEVFKLKLHYEKNPSVFCWIGSTFEEEKLKDILDKWLEENK